MIIILTALTYYLLAKVSFLAVLADPGPGLAPIWLPTGFAVAAIYFFGYRVWPGIALGSLLNAAGSSPPVIIGFVLANTLDPLLVAWLPRKILKKDIDLARHKDILIFAFVVLFLSSVFSASLGVTLLWWDESLTTNEYALNWLVWWISDALSVFILTPLLLVWRHRPKWSGASQHWQEYSLGLCLAIAGLFFILAMPLGQETVHFAYWLFPFVIWCGFRRSAHIMTLGVSGLAIVTIIATSMGLGPFVGTLAGQSYFHVQSFLTVSSLTALLVSALVSERDRAVRNRDEFILIASHELHTPLKVLSMAARFMDRLINKGQLDTMSRAQQVDLVKMNSRETRRLANLVEELVEGSKIAADQLVIEPTKTDLAAVVKETIGQLSEKIEESGSWVRFSEGEPMEGQWDPQRLQFVCKTLISNALKFGRGNGITVSLERAGGSAKLSVVDRGIGIHESDLGLIFERFSQSSALSEFGGLGQGLFISKAIILAHGGNIGVQSEPGKGSTFTVELPFKQH